jgi:hypothetical protein
VIVPALYWIIMSVVAIATLIIGIAVGFILAKRRRASPESPPSPPETPEIKPAAPSGISITNFQVMPERVVPGSNVGIIVNITNSSQSKIQHKLDLKINGEIKAFQDVPLAAGETREVVFMTTAGEPGDYRVDINDLSSKFTVMPGS